MAFYSRSVNDVDAEIDRPKSCLEYDSRYYQNISDRTSTVSRQASSIEGIYSRYINSVESIAKADISMESLSDTLPSIVPPLDLNSSGESMPSTDSPPGVSFTINKHQASELSQSSAFNNWLSGKKRLKSCEEEKQKAIQEKHRQQLEQRKQIAKQKYQEWLAKKTQPKDKPLLQTEMQKYQKVCESHDDNNESNRKAWEQKKLQEQRQKKEKILKDREQHKILEEKRKQQASRAWQNWIAEAPLKPKPVPLNKGFLSLRGTISDIYVNPNPWREPFEPLEVDECD